MDTPNFEEFSKLMDAAHTYANKLGDDTGETKDFYIEMYNKIADLKLAQANELYRHKIELYRHKIMMDNISGHIADVKKGGAAASAASHNDF
jgi:hypothetical protein